MSALIYVPATASSTARACCGRSSPNFRLSLENVVSKGYRLRAAGVPLARSPRSVILGSFGYWTGAAQNLPDVLGRVYAEAPGELK